MARKGLPKKYAKMGFKRGWQEYRKSKRAPTRKRTSTPKRTYRRKNTMARKRSYRRSAKKIVTKQFIDGAMSQGGKWAINNFVGQNPIYEAGFDFALGWVRNNKTLMGQGVTNIALNMVLGNVLGMGKGQEPWVGQ